MSSEVSREIETNEIRDGQSTPRAPSHSTSLEQVFYYYFLLLLLVVVIERLLIISYFLFLL